MLLLQPRRPLLPQQHRHAAHLAPLLLLLCLLLLGFLAVVDGQVRDLLPGHVNGALDVQLVLRAQAQHTRTDLGSGRATTTHTAAMTKLYLRPCIHVVHAAADVCAVDAD